MKKQIFSKIPRNFIAFMLSFAFVGLAFAASPPSQVSGVKTRLVGDNSVHLSWDEATSEEGIIVGYKLYYGKNSVQNADQVYDDDIEIGLQTSYPIESLEPGETYYFAVTALDDELNQSLNYSEEVSMVIPGEKIVEEVIEEPKEENNEVIETVDNNLKEVEEILENMENNTENQEKPAAPVDVAAPMDAKNIFVDKSPLENGNSVSIRWQKSANLDGDVIDQVFYAKKGNGNWDQGYSIGKDLEEMVFDVKRDQNYQVRIVTIDTSGNRSAGSSISFSTESLATSGPGMLIPLGVVAIFMFFYLSFRRQS